MRHFGTLLLSICISSLVCLRSNPCVADGAGANLPPSPQSSPQPGIPTITQAQSDSVTLPIEGSDRPLFSYTTLTALGVHQFSKSFDGGEFAVSRSYLEWEVPLSGDARHSFATRVFWNRDHYRFAGSRGFASRKPWRTIDTLAVGSFFRYSPSRQTTFIAIPQVQFSAEEGGELGEGLQVGGIAFASFALSERFAIGPGIGVNTQIEEQAQIFPVVALNWSITDAIVLRTGSGVGTTGGPGLVLDWQLSDTWNASVGGRIERRRFRLDKHGVAADGVGQEDATPLYLVVTHAFSPLARLKALLGVSVAGRLGLEGSRGQTLDSERFGTTLFLGMLFEAKF